MTDQTIVLTSRQFMILTFGLMVGASILITPVGLVMVAREDAWIAAILGSSINLACVGLYILIMQLYPGKNYMEVSELVLGKWLGKAVTFGFVSYAMQLCSVLICNIGFFVTNEVMSNTPIEVIQLLFLLPLFMCAHLGLVTLGRMADVVFPIVLVALTVFLLSLMPQLKLHYIQPILEGGLRPVFMAGLNFSSFQEPIFMLALYSHVEKQKGANKGLVVGTIIGSLMLITLVLFSVLVLGIEQSANSTYPAYALAKTINIGNFFQRIEGSLIVIWVLTVFIKSAICLFIVLYGLKKLFGLKSSEWLNIPVILIIYVFSLDVYDDLMKGIDQNNTFWRDLTVAGTVVIPAGIYIVAKVKQFMKR